MPFKSRAQQRWMFAAEERGEVPKGTARRWARHTKSVKALPEKKKEAMTKFHKAAAALEGQGFAGQEIDQILAQLVMLQHHLDDAEVYGGTGNQEAAHLSIDDAEENVERVAEKTLPPQKAEIVETVAEQGDEEEEEAGVEEEGHESEKEARANDAFEIGMRYTFHKQGFDNARIDALVDVAKGVATGSVKTAHDIHQVMIPHVLASRVKTAFLGTTLGAGVGAGVGAMREKDEGEGRLRAILRSMLTGAATGLGADVGGTVGSLAGLLGGPLAPATVPLGQAAGAGAGASAAHMLARRKPKKDVSAKKDDEKKTDEPADSKK